jgi:uncharacterized membrane protein (DUF2068 family)
MGHSYEVKETALPAPVPSPRPPGTAGTRRFRPKLHYELIGCGLHGHSLVGTDVAEIRPEDALVVREGNGMRWHRCLRCDVWIALPPPQEPVAQTVPPRDQIKLPLRGKPLRDRFVLRLISLDRVVHFLVLGAFAAAIILFAQDKARLKGEYTRILNAIQGAVGGPLFDTKHNSLLNDINHLFTLSSTKLYLYGSAVAIYAAINGLEAVGLWRARRWAEYLTLVELVALLPLAIYELSIRVTTLKTLTLVLDVLIILYLLIAKRLFGVRGGGRVEHEERERDTGWPAIERATPAFAGAPLAMAEVGDRSELEPASP